MTTNTDVSKATLTTGGCFRYVVQGCEMTQSPEILTLLLKRFHFDYKRRCFVKLHGKVDVPQTLHLEVCFQTFISAANCFDLTYFKCGDFVLFPSLQNCTYDLYALVHHFGNLTGGHYTAQIKSFETLVWYHFNDDIVEGVRRLIFLYAVQFHKSFNNMKLNIYCDIVFNSTGQTTTIWDWRQLFEVLYSLPPHVQEG